MATILDYVRQAHSPLQADLSPADALALSCLVYVDFHALPGPRSPRGCLLREVAQASSIPSLYRYSSPTHEDRPLLEAAGSSARFGGLRVCDAVTRLGTRPLAQFGAATFIDEAGATYVVFRARMRARSGGRRMPDLALIFPRIRSGGPPTTWRMRRRARRGRSWCSVTRRAPIVRSMRRRLPLPQRFLSCMPSIPLVSLLLLSTMGFSTALTSSCAST